MSKLTTLTSKKYLCTVGSKGPSYQCGECVFHPKHNSSACIAVRKVNLHPNRLIQEMIDTL